MELRGEQRLYLLYRDEAKDEGVMESERESLQSPPSRVWVIETRRLVQLGGLTMT